MLIGLLWVPESVAAPHSWRHPPRPSPTRAAVGLDFVPLPLPHPRSFLPSGRLLPSASPTLTGPRPHSHRRWGGASTWRRAFSPGLSDSAPGVLVDWAAACRRGVRPIVCVTKPSSFSCRAGGATRLYCRRSASLSETPWARAAGASIAWTEESVARSPTSTGARQHTHGFRCKEHGRGYIRQQGSWYRDRRRRARMLHCDSWMANSRINAMARGRGKRQIVGKVMSNSFYSPLIQTS
jgi:hypothetical protein